MAAHDRMKMMQLPAVKTVGENQINYCFRMEEINKCNLYFHDLNYFHLKYDRSPHVMETSQSIKECFFTLTSVVRCEITTFVCKNLKIIGKKGRPNNNGQCLRTPLQRSLKKKITVRRFTLDQKGKSIEHSHVLNIHIKFGFFHFHFSLCVWN